MTRRPARPASESYTRYGQPLLDGDRYVEYAWIASQMPHGSGPCWDVGCGAYSPLGLLAALHGWTVTAYDLCPVSRDYRAPHLSFRQQDIRDAEGPVDLILNCSTLEHVGVAGRYGITEDDPDADLEVMAHLAKASAEGTSQLLTVPVARETVRYGAHHTVYGPDRLGQILADWTVIQSAYWIKTAEDPVWHEVPDALAFAQPPQPTLYGLGCYVLCPRGAT